MKLVLSYQVMYVYVKHVNLLYEKYISDSPQSFILLARNLWGAFTSPGETKQFIGWYSFIAYESGKKTTVCACNRSVDKRTHKKISVHFSVGLFFLVLYQGRSQKDWFISFECSRLGCMVGQVHRPQ